MAEEKDAVERAKEILVYGPIGLALYMRDTAPSFLKVFVARGRAEFDERKRTVGQHLGQARDVGQDTVSPGSAANAAASAAASSASAAAPQVLRLVSESLGKVIETAEGALGAFGVRGSDAPAAPGASRAAPSHQAPFVQSPSHESGVPPSPPIGSGVDMAASPPVATGAPGADVSGSELAIPDYDELSASQVVDRLEGLAPASLEAILTYESAHRGRATIIGKIEQLGQTG